MKKLFLLIPFLILASGVFSEPKIPKAYEEDPYEYLSNDFTNYYEIYYCEYPSAKLKYMFHFKKKSLIYGSHFDLDICFETDKQLINFIKDIHLSDLENEFIRIRKFMIDNDANMRIINTSPYHVIYEMNGSNIK